MSARNVLPDINELIKDNQWHKALDILHKTNNFPEFTGRLCPALCEAACTLGINDEAATTKEIELSVIEKGFKEGWVLPRPAVIKTGQKSCCCRLWARWINSCSTIGQMGPCCYGLRACGRNWWYFSPWYT